MKKCIVICAFCLCLCGCVSQTKTAYEPGAESKEMTVVDSNIAYTIYRHDKTGVYYFVTKGTEGRGVCIMVNPDGSPYTG